MNDCQCILPVKFFHDRIQYGIAQVNTISISRHFDTQGAFSHTTPDLGNAAIYIRQWQTRRPPETIRLQQSLISVRESIAPRYNDFETDFLSPLVYTGTDDFRPIRAAYLDDDGRLLNQSAIPLNYKYSPLLGYFEQKEKK